MKKFDKMTENFYNHPMYNLAITQLEKEGKFDNGTIHPLEYTWMIFEKFVEIRNVLEKEHKNDFFKPYFKPE